MVLHTLFFPATIQASTLVTSTTTLPSSSWMVSKPPRKPLNPPLRAGGFPGSPAHLAGVPAGPAPGLQREEVLGQRLGQGRPGGGGRLPASAQGGAAPRPSHPRQVDVPVLSNRECEAALQATRLGQDFLLHPVTVSLPKTSLPRASSVPGARRARTRARVTVEGRSSVRSGGAGTLWASSAGASAVERSVEEPFFYDFVFLHSCLQSNVPGVYTRVSHYNQWIQDMMFKV